MYVRALLTLYIISIFSCDGKIKIYERESGKLIQELFHEEVKKCKNISKFGSDL